MAICKWVSSAVCESLAVLVLLVCSLILYILPTSLQSLINRVRESILPLSDGRTFKAYIYKDELKSIRRWVRQKDNIETGGDLFGLWLDRHNAVIQFVLGPGKNCRRTTISFYQDTDYLANVGGYITKNQGLCNVGQWHSHHRLRLTCPSTGDEGTVWNNMPALGMERYIVFIATISDIDKVDVNCFLFEIENEKKLSVLPGEICEFGEDSPVQMSRELTNLVESGKEIEDKTDAVFLDVD